MPRIFSDQRRGFISRAGSSSGRAEFAPELDDGEGEMDTKHEHMDCPPNQRRWLERRLDLAATMRPHAYCVTCGKVKNLDGARARKLGFYLSGFSALKEYLERNANCAKMTQSQSRLITKALEGLEEFEDPYGLSLEVQARHYLGTVKRVRPDLDDELILRMLPETRRRSRKPLIEIMGRASSV